MLFRSRQNLFQVMRVLWAREPSRSPAGLGHCELRGEAKVHALWVPPFPLQALASL